MKGWVPRSEYAWAVRDSSAALQLFASFDVYAACNKGAAVTWTCVR